MIEINLLPPELKLKKAKRSGFEPRQLIYFIPLVFAALILAHIFLMGLRIAKAAQLNGLNKKWQRLEPQRKGLESFRKEYEGLSLDARMVPGLAEKRINWAQNLNKLSLSLTPGIWFNQISVTTKDFTLQGSVLSLQKEEVTLINKFMDSLKSDAGFFKDFTNLELSSVQRRTVGGYDIADFVLTGALKSK